MPDNISKYNAKRRAEKALQAAENLQKRAAQAIEAAQQELKKLERPQSPGDGRYEVSVKFDRGGTTYTFLLLINRGVVYTTAVKDGGQFASFDAFYEWLEGKDAFWVSDLYTLRTDGTALEWEL